ncbi:MAG: Bug family tripartite tricarboxylate transporter substrate binding protein [Lautropia sp.]
MTVNCPSALDRRTVLGALASVPLALGLAAAARAQDAYPSRPVKIVVPVPPGPPADIVSRVIASSLAAQYGQSFVIENKVGAGGFVAMQQISTQTRPDGYTLLSGGLGTQVLPPVIFQNLPLDPMKTFAPVAFLGDMYNVFIVRADSPIQSMDDLLRLVKDKPGAVTIGSQPAGSSPHMGYALLAQQTDTTWNFVPYKGPNEVLSDVLSGVVDVGTSQLPGYAAIIKSGRVRALAVSAPARAAIFPDVPTVAEAGVPGYAVSSWLGFFTLASTPQPIVDGLSKSIATALADPGVRSQLLATGFAPGHLNPQEFAKRIEQDFALWSGVAKRAGIRMTYGQ